MTKMTIGISGRDIHQGLLLTTKKKETRIQQIMIKDYIRLSIRFFCLSFKCMLIKLFKHEELLYFAYR